jgi:hypothetical protein
MSSAALQAARALSDIQQRNRTLAQENLNMQEEIEQARNHLAVVKSSEFAAAKATFSELQARQAAVLDTCGPAVIMSTLCRDVEKVCWPRGYDKTHDTLSQQHIPACRCTS